MNKSCDGSEKNRGGMCWIEIKVRSKDIPKYTYRKKFKTVIMLSDRLSAYFGFHANMGRPLSSVIAPSNLSSCRLDIRNVRLQHIQNLGTLTQTPIIIW